MIFRALSMLMCASAIASAADVTPPAVETMDCSQMTAEMIVAGKRMKDQMDPEFAKEAQAMMAEAQADATGAIVQGVGMSLACAIPGIDMFCMITNPLQSMMQGGQAEENMARMEAQAARMEKAMEGLDMARLEALSQRFEQQKCKVPEPRE